VDEVIRRQTTFDPGRFEPSPGEPTMLAVVTSGNGGLDKLEYREVRRPQPGAGEVLVRVLAAGVNNTEINTRVGWYSAAVDAGTRRALTQEAEAVQRADGGWDAPTPFPFIQGTDCCGRVESVGPGGDQSLLGRRVLVRPCMRPRGFESTENVWMGSDFDGAFAQFVKAPASEAFPVESALSDVELGAIPCAYGTAENMLQRAGVSAGQHVVVTGSSGGVGSAAVQLARLRGAEVTAVAGAGKAKQVLALGAARIVGRDDDIAAALGERSVDVVVDNVSGPGLNGLLATLRPGGAYASSGAIAGPKVSFDKRVFYLHDLRMIGCTAWDEPVFPALIARIEGGELRPRVAHTYALERIADAQSALLEKRHVGKLVLVPPAGQPAGPGAYRGGT
jgi:NADPH:quinone reductase-like Zn-dependent oxidoreductase